MGLKQQYLQSVESGQPNIDLFNLLDAVDKSGPIQVSQDAVTYCEADAKSVYEMFSYNVKRNIQAVEELGKQIGYGALMSYASALWRYSLVHEHQLPPDGAFVPRISTELSDEDIVADQWVSSYFRDKNNEVTKHKLETITRDVICIHVNDASGLLSTYHFLCNKGYRWQGISVLQARHVIRNSLGHVYVVVDKSRRLATLTQGRPNLDLRIHNMAELCDIDEFLYKVFEFH